MSHTDHKLNQVIQSLKIEFQPAQIFLFGSRARGDHQSNSDYDLLLVDAKSNLPVVERMLRASEVLRPLGVSADVFFYSKEKFEEWKNEFSSLPELVIREGRELDIG